jgi:hypothetical protein
MPLICRLTARMLSSVDIQSHIQQNPRCIYGFKLTVSLLIRCVRKLAEWSTDEVPAQDVLEKGLNDLIDLCDVVIDKFEEARDNFES